MPFSTEIHMSGRAQLRYNPELEEPMIRRFWFVFLTAGLFAQQLIIPDELEGKQRVIYEELTQAVSTPCCRNGIPVAYHESGQALMVRDRIKEMLIEGKDRQEIVAALDAMRFGEDNAELIWTIPRDGGIDYVVWLAPAALILIGLVVIGLIVRKGGKKTARIDEQALYDKYHDVVLKDI